MEDEKGEEETSRESGGEGRGGRGGGRRGRRPEEVRSRVDVRSLCSTRPQTDRPSEGPRGHKYLTAFSQLKQIILMRNLFN